MNAPVQEPITLPGTRVCKRCGWARKYPECFHKHPGFADGRNKACAECCNKALRNRPERRIRSVASELEDERAASIRENARAERVTAAAFARLRANTESAITRPNPSDGPERTLIRWEHRSGEQHPAHDGPIVRDSAGVVNV